MDMIPPSQSHTYEFVHDFFSDLGKAETLVDRWVEL